MRKGLVFSCLVALLSWSVAEAGCAWVLWQQTSIRSSSGGKNRPPPHVMPWRTLAAYPEEEEGFAFCVLAMRKAAEQQRAVDREVFAPATSPPVHGDAESSVWYIVIGDEGAERKTPAKIVTQRFQCLPDTVQPSK